MPSAREGAKNRADIKLAVDAMELAYSRDHLDNFVIVSGDSDFTPLVGKLRELEQARDRHGQQGVGERPAHRQLRRVHLLRHHRRHGRRALRATGRPRAGDPVALLQETLTALAARGHRGPALERGQGLDPAQAPGLRRGRPGFGTFSKFLEDAAKKGIIRLETDPAAAPTASRWPTAPARRGAGPAAAAARTSRARTARAGGVAAPAGGGPPRDVGGARRPTAGEVFEFVVTPRSEPQPDLSELPPLDQPISYEDMILLGPEIGEDVPDLAEATDTGRGRAAGPRVARAGAAGRPSPSPRWPTWSRSTTSWPPRPSPRPSSWPRSSWPRRSPRSWPRRPSPRRWPRCWPRRPWSRRPPSRSRRPPAAAGAAYAAGRRGPPPPPTSRRPRSRRRGRRRGARAAPAHPAQGGRARGGGRGGRGPGSRGPGRGGPQAQAPHPAQGGRARGGGRGPGAGAEEAPAPKRRHPAQGGRARGGGRGGRGPGGRGPAEEAPKPRRRTRRKAAEEVPAEV